MVKVGDFCTVIKDHYNKYGIGVFTTVFVAGECVIPLSEEDPYVMRKLFLVGPVVDDHVTKGVKPVMMNGLNLDPMDELEIERLTAIMMVDFKPEETEEEE